ncbi:MAG: hypothetical protein K8R68_11780, partial [Bacteroidales bacterium]|nr:hypothetical protein [Bacteroidales bacterium]
PGGVHKTFTKEEREYFLDGKQIPNIDTMIEWSKEIIDFMKNYHFENAQWIDNFVIGNKDTFLTQFLIF